MNPKCMRRVACQPSAPRRPFPTTIGHRAAAANDPSRENRMVWIVAAAVVVLAGAGWWLRRRPDTTSIGRSFAAYLASNHPELPSARLTPDALEIPTDGGDMRIDLHNLAGKVRAARGATAGLFQAYAKTIIASDRKSVV